MYRPLQVFTVIEVSFRNWYSTWSTLLYYFTDGGNGHIQSLILAMMLIIIGAQTFMLALQADVISANRKLLEDIQFRMKNWSLVCWSLTEARKNQKVSKKQMEEKMSQKKVNKKKLLITASTFPRYEGDTEPRFILIWRRS